MRRIDSAARQGSWIAYWLLTVLLVLGAVLTTTQPMSLIGAISQHYVDSTSPTWVSTITGYSPLIWWRLGEASGTTINDASGNSRSGTYNATGVTLGATGAIAHDSDTAVTTSGVVTGSIANAAWMTQSDYTAWVWVKTTVGNTQMLAWGRDFSSTSRGFSLGVNASGVPAFGNSGSVFQLGVATIADGTWHLLVGVRDGTAGTFTLYVDGTQAASGSGADSTGAGCGLYLGARGNNSLQWNGSIDEVGYVDGKLTASQIATMWTDGADAPRRISTAAGTSTTGASFATSPTAGNLLLLAVSVVNASTTTNSCSTPSGWNTGPSKALVNGTVGGSVFTFWKIAAGGDANPTFTITGANTGTATVIEEWDGIATSGTLDTTFTAGQWNNVSGSQSCGTATTTAARTWIWAVVGGWGSATPAFTWGDSLSHDRGGVSSSSKCFAAWKVLFASASDTPSCSVNQTMIAGIVAMAFKRA